MTEPTMPFTPQDLWGLPFPLENRNLSEKAAGVLFDLQGMTNFKRFSEPFQMAIQLIQFTPDELHNTLRGPRRSDAPGVLSVEECKQVIELFRQMRDQADAIEKQATASAREAFVLRAIGAEVDA